MKKAAILFVAVLVAGIGSVTIAVPPAQAAKKSNQDNTGLIKKGMTLEEAEQATGVVAAAVGAPNNGVQTYRISYRQNTGDGGVNDHPTITVYMFGVKNDKVTWVHKNQ